MRCHGNGTSVDVVMATLSVVKESGDEEDEDTEQENKEDDTAAVVLGRGHRNALLANRTRVSI